MVDQTASEEQTAEALVARMFTAALGTQDLLHIYIGSKLGLYELMVAAGEIRPAELAERAGMHPRYAREWLEQQAVTGILVVKDAAEPSEDRRYELPAAHAEVLTSEESMNYYAPVAAALVSATQRMPDLLDAYRTGQGLNWSAYGPDMWQSQAALNRPMFVNKLGQEYLPSVPALDSIFRRKGVRVADLACGGGWSSIAMARAYPDVSVDGYDLDAPSIQQAGAAAAAAGLSDRVHFTVSDAAAMTAGQHSYDLITIFEALHDVSNPVGLLRTARGMLRHNGPVLVVDERVADEFTAPGDELERFSYGWSMTVCLPCGMSEQPSAATGTVMRRSKLEEYAREAGFKEVEVLPIHDESLRFYLIKH